MKSMRRSVDESPAPVKKLKADNNHASLDLAQYENFSNSYKGLFYLPRDMGKEIARFLPASAIINLSQVSKNFSLLRTCDYYKWAFDEFRKLLSHLTLGELKPAEKIWENDPLLLICRGTIYHPNRHYSDDSHVDIPLEKNPGRYLFINHSPLQIVLRNEEDSELVYRMKKAIIDKMNETEKSVAKTLKNSIVLEEIRKQYWEIFPNGDVQCYRLEYKKFQSLLITLMEIVIQDESIKIDDLSIMNQNTKNALMALYHYVKPAPESQTGLVFDYSFYYEAFSIYRKSYNKFMNNDQRRFWSVRVGEYLASLLGTNDLRDHCEGVAFFNPVNERGCLLGNDSYFAFRREPDSYPGLHFFVGVSGTLRKNEHRSLDILGHDRNLLRECNKDALSRFGKNL